ncbi:MAG: 4-aminobutyrate--2-oxoglutarate transaminase [Actinobacteria bacterium]|nr:4-aminobutyrate--2-oxoglutarate transaminase [Actinomycetota bacterium]MBA3566786.1 4-aminobutyrate--2-oxoglutarate transaminase [Actinomycetota bacterium]MDQ3425903.1 4-aminobutyrate--2-oxoglutarate transaminase [Actinomycetota bacterium]
MATTRVIELRTEIPGPRAREFLEREARAVARPVAVHTPVVAAEAHGSTITDVDGNTFIDFVGGVGVMNVGHGHPRVVQAIHEQVDRFLHTDFTVVAYELYVELAERLGALVPLSGETRSAFFNAGAEAVENAVKLARLYTGRQAVIAFDGAFHGRTLLALTMTSRTHPYKTGLGPFAPEVYRAPYPNAYRGPDTETALATLERMFSTHVPAEHVAAVVFEPQQGEGGFIPAPPAFVEGLRRICDERGIVLIADEVQTGFGRTGRMFAMEHFDVEADLITVAKSIAGGLPLSGVIGRAAIMDHAHQGAIGGTFIGNPVALAAAGAVLDVFEEEELVARALLLGDALRSRMLEWQERWPQIGDVRGLGAMLAIELVGDPVTRIPAPHLVSEVIEAALQRGLLLLKAGVDGNCIRVLCPLTISDAELGEGLGVWDEALTAVLG